VRVPLSFFLRSSSLALPPPLLSPPLPLLPSFSSLLPPPPSFSLAHSSHTLTPSPNSLIDQGGDWDRRNRLKVYQGLHLLTIRSFKRAATLLLDALSTFTATELLSYNDFVGYAVVAGGLTLGRVELKKRVRFLSLVPKLNLIFFPPTVNIRIGG
jgi:hypothetical protein